MLFFFFKQKTAYEITTGDWSSDVCSSDLVDLVGQDVIGETVAEHHDGVEGQRAADERPARLVSPHALVPCGGAPDPGPAGSGAPAAGPLAPAARSATALRARSERPAPWRCS